MKKEMKIRIEKLARIIVEHSLKIKKNDVVQISGGIPARPLILELYRQILKKGAYPRVNVDFEGLGYNYYKYASYEQLRNFPKISMYEMKNTDALVYIGAPENRYELAKIPSEKIMLRQKILDPIDKERMKKRWLLFYYPVKDYAKDAGMTLSEFEDFVFESCLLDWKKQAEKMRKLKSILDKGKIVRIVGKDTDLSFSIAGRNAVIGDGSYNMPDGEIYTAPHENTVNGEIAFTFPLIDMGREISGINLKFENGRLVKATAKKNAHILKTIIGTDKGASKIGELGIGCNYSIKKFVKATLFDEKIGGTVHLALGKAYKECKGTNVSAVHKDIIKDLRKPFGGKIFIDNKLIQKEGKFLI